MKISVVIPSYNHWNLAHSRMLELYKYLPDGNEIILVNDASTEDDVSSGSAWWQKHSARHVVRYHENETNLGFIGSMNNGAEIALRHNADVIVLLSNDVVISGDVFTEVCNVIEQYHGKVLIGNEKINYAAGWNEVPDENGNTVIVPWLNGWFLACSADAWKAMGGFDPRYGVSDFEDVDISLTAISLGYNLVALNSTKLKHLVAQSFGYNEKRLERTKHNKELFIQKWQPQLSNLHDKLIAQTR
jgi:GT2 family glycosyltransferase